MNTVLTVLLFLFYIAGTFFRKYCSGTLLGRMDVSVMSPIMSAVVILSGAAVSLILHEKINRFCIASVLLAVIAVVI